MNDTSNALSLPLGSLPLGPLKIALAALLVLNLAGCDALARFTAKPDQPADEPAIAEEAPAPIPASKEQKPIKEHKIKPSPLYEWKGEGQPVTRIVINTNEQKAHFYHGGDEIGWATVATGVAKHPTPTGKFQVTEKVENKRSNLYGKVYGKGGRVLRSSVKVGRDPIPSGGRFEGATMPYFMRLTGDGVGLHAGPIPRPGQPASHGCIRMPKKIAPVVFAHVSTGTEVEIVGKGPSYGDYVSKQRAIAAQRKRAADQRAVTAQKAPAKKPAAAAPTPKIAAAPAAKPAAKPTNTPAPAVSGAAIEGVAEAEDTAAAAQTPQAAPPRETRMRAPAEATTQAPAQPDPVASPAAPEAPKPAESSPAPTAGTPAPQAAAAKPEPTPQPTPPAQEAVKPAAEPKAAEKPVEPPKAVLETKEVALPPPKPAAPAPAAEKPPAAAPKPAAAPAPKPAEPAPETPKAPEGAAG
ncbi:L,D-transpeptidase [Thiocystis violacea]|uniref:L,D-transpeptidase n=1 Tax=Thiocystis violacea TaxID=13725 RepID=UPI001906E851|nr:L,D-transpeptidase [Thiocystis violacea]MBK1723919.1 hypothetical protein [Thiocystis violacea]